MTSSGPKRRRPKTDRPPEFPPDNELPVPLNVGPFIWRSADVGITATGFLAYSTGVTFRLVALSKGVSLQDEDPIAEASLVPFPHPRPAGSLRLGAQDVPVTVHMEVLVRIDSRSTPGLPSHPKGISSSIWSGPLRALSTPSSAYPAAPGQRPLLSGHQRTCNEERDNPAASDQGRCLTI